MKVLLVSAAFYPEISPRSFRATELATELSRQGHSVKVITKDLGETAGLYCKSRHIDHVSIPPLVWGRTTSLSANWIVGMIMRLWRRMLLMAFEYPDIELAIRFYRALR